MAPTGIVISEIEAANRLGISLRTMQRMRTDGGGPVWVRLTSRRIGYTPEAVAAWVEQRSVASGASEDRVAA